MAAGNVRSWLKGTALAGDFGAPQQRGTAEFTYRWGTNVPRSHPLNVRGQKAAGAIREETDGRLDLQLFPNNELGGDSRMFARLRSGELECFSLSGANVLSNLDGLGMSVFVGQAPNALVIGHISTSIIVSGRAPEIGSQRGIEQLHAAESEGAD